MQLKVVNRDLFWHSLSNEMLVRTTTNTHLQEIFIRMPVSPSTSILSPVEMIASLGEKNPRLQAKTLVCTLCAGRFDSQPSFSDFPS
jgi:hypothetical protein